MVTEQNIDDRPDQVHPTNVAHHFESAQQQFDAGKLGIWLFLVTEVLFFSGLFVAYAVYRANHPEVFVDAHKYLNTTLGTLNTVVLLVSSLTMAWAVRSAQLNQAKSLVWLLTATLACANLFLGVKAVEYSHKWDKGLLWAGAFAYSSRAIDENVESDQITHAEHPSSNALVTLSVPAILLLTISASGFAIMHVRQKLLAKYFWLCLIFVGVAFFGGVVTGQVVEHYSENTVQSNSEEPTSSVRQASWATSDDYKQRFTGVFFSIYFAMTGVHVIHIVAGMGVITWLLWRSIHGDFGEDYFGPVDYAGLYWHLVDLVWIYLFPLLYLLR